MIEHTVGEEPRFTRWLDKRLFVPIDWGLAWPYGPGLVLDLRTPTQSLAQRAADPTGQPSGPVGLGDKAYELLHAYQTGAVKLARAYAARAVTADETPRVCAEPGTPTGLALEAWARFQVKR